MNTGNLLITSKQNPKIKGVVALQKSSERKETGLFIIEGIKEIEKALLADYQFSSVFYYPEIVDRKLISLLKTKAPNAEYYEVNAEVYSKIAYREASGGVLVIAKAKKHTFENIQIGENPLLLVIEGIEKPGNLGAIYRTADAAGLDAIVICDPRADLYNPNAVRASLGCIFTVPTIVSTTSEVIEWLKKSTIKIYCTYLQAAIPYHTANYKEPSAIVMGTEATGITQAWVDAADANIIIPMSGAADSLNVSTSTAIVVFEAKRQRGF